MTRVVESSSDVLVLDLEKDMVVLSTAGCPKIFNYIRYVVFKRVPKNFGYTDLDKYCQELSETLNLDYQRTTIFLTAVDISTYSSAKIFYRDVEAEVFITLGIDSPSCVSIEQDNSFEKTVGTINIAVVVNKPLSRLALLDLFRLVSEVKGALIALGGPQCINGVSIGTASDAIAVIAPEGFERFAGVATDVGIAVSKALVKALTNLLTKVSVGDYVAQTLGLKSFDDVVRVAEKIYSYAPIPKLEKNVVVKEVEEELLKALSDPNIQILVRGMKLAEVCAQLGLIPSITFKEFSSDTPRIIVDELVGKALSEYINGFKGLLAYYWVERLKERGGIPEVGMFPPIADDLLGALVGATLSRVYDRYAQNRGGE
jgi:alpha-ribazole phosphatase CobZ